MLASLSEADRNAILNDLTEAQARELMWDWEFWARPAQLPPPGNWSTWAIIAGRGFGKTRTGCEWLRANVYGDTPLSKGRYRRIAIVAETAADARDVIVEGESGILATSPPGFRPFYQPSKRRITWQNGAIGLLFNATEPDQLRGPNFDAAYCDELAKWYYAQETWDNLQFALRLGSDPRVVITTTPRPIPTLIDILKDATTVKTSGPTSENEANLSEKFLKKVYSRYEGTRLGRQELSGELLTDVVGALWTRTMIDHARVKVPTPTMQRIVVAVDPSGTKGEIEDEANDVGIVVVGKGVDGDAYVLADRTCNLSPAGWARRAVQAYEEFSADRLVAERNFGGAMVESTVRTADTKKIVSYKEVVASRGKVARAEPVAALYEQKRVHHVALMPQLEDQMTQITGEGFMGNGSPDRVDALVWALTELMLGASSYTLRNVA